MDPGNNRHEHLCGVEVVSEGRSRDFFLFSDLGLVFFSFFNNIIIFLVVLEFALRALYLLDRHSHHLSHPARPFFCDRFIQDMVLQTILPRTDFEP